MNMDNTKKKSWKDFRKLKQTIIMKSNFYKQVKNLEIHATVNDFI